MFLLVHELGKIQPQQQPAGKSSKRYCVTRAKRSTRGSDAKMVNTRQAQRLSDGEEKAEGRKAYAYHGICYL